MIGKKCLGHRIGIEHYFLANPNANPAQKWAENLGYCAVCFSMVPRSSTSLSQGFEKKYQKRNDRIDILPSKDYE